MSSRTGMLESALNLLQDAVAVLDMQSKVVFWNKAAAALTGYQAGDLLDGLCPPQLFKVDEAHLQHLHVAGDGHLLDSPTLVSVRHRQGHAVPAMLRRAELRDAQDELNGHVLLFYPVEQNDTLPHGECVECAVVERSQAAMEDRLDAAQHQWLTNRVPFGLLWITVDQAKSLRRTHGRDACEAMMHAVEHTLQRHLKPADALGRWGDDDFLVLAHERAPELLGEHARRLAGVARTADFRWWGDRVGLSVSIGATPACAIDSLQSLLERARQATQASIYAGGNQVTEARGELCSQS
jgi:diguanylate cyclase (GGDEF)-like protein/PAS domain S-box-containing protein